MRGRTGEREGENLRWVRETSVVSLALVPTGDSPKPRHVTWPGKNQGPFTLRDDAPSTQLHWSGPVFFFIVIFWWILWLFNRLCTSISGEFTKYINERQGYKFMIVKKWLFNHCSLLLYGVYNYFSVFYLIWIQHWQVLFLMHFDMLSLFHQDQVFIARRLFHYFWEQNTTWSKQKYECLLL